MAPERISLPSTTRESPHMSDGQPCFHQSGLLTSFKDNRGSYIDKAGRRLLLFFSIVAEEAATEKVLDGGEHCWWLVVGEEG